MLKTLILLILIVNVSSCSCILKCIIIIIVFILCPFGFLYRMAFRVCCSQDRPTSRIHVTRPRQVYGHIITSIAAGYVNIIYMGAFNLLVILNYIWIYLTRHTMYCILKFTIAVHTLLQSKSKITVLKFQSNLLRESYSCPYPIALIWEHFSTHVVNFLRQRTFTAMTEN